MNEDMQRVSKGRNIIYTLPKNPLPLTEEQKREIEEARKLPFVYDEDCPPQIKEELKQFRRANARKAALPDCAILAVG